MRQTVHWSKSALSRRRFLPAGCATRVTGTVSSLSPRGSDGRAAPTGGR